MEKFESKSGLDKIKSKPSNRKASPYKNPKNFNKDLKSELGSKPKLGNLAEVKSIDRLTYFLNH